MSDSTQKKRLVLFNPSPWRGTPYYGLPLPLLAISALPHAEGYPITIVVEDVDDDAEARVLEACKDALLLGVTTLTGSMIGQGLDVCRKVRERYPNLPIVWGGTHPSIAPEQTCEHPLVDIVVAGQGEATFLDLVHALEEGRPIESVPGIYYKRDGKVLRTECRPTIELDSVPDLPFELIEMERFTRLFSASMPLKVRNQRASTYYTSYGCPFSCSFCSEPLTSSRRWFAKSPEKAVAEIETLHRKYGIDVVVFEDPILFVDMKRVRRIAELLLERDVHVRWTATSRLETIKKIDQATWDVLRRSGLTQVYIGIESAHPDVLKSIGKKYTADDIVEAARILGEQQVSLVSSFIQGIPLAPSAGDLADIMRRDMVIASQTMLRIYEANPKASITVFMYTPYPGAVAFEYARQHGFKPPESLEGWTSFIHQENQVPWLLPEQELFAKLSLIGAKSLRGDARQRIHRRKFKGLLLYAYSAVTKARFRRGYFKHPIEQRLAHRLARKFATGRDVDSQNKGVLL